VPSPILSFLEKVFRNGAITQSKIFVFHLQRVKLLLLSNRFCKKWSTLCCATARVRNNAFWFYYFRIGFHTCRHSTTNSNWSLDLVVETCNVITYFIFCERTTTRKVVLAGVVCYRIEGTEYPTQRAAS